MSNAASAEPVRGGLRRLWTPAAPPSARAWHWLYRGVLVLLACLVLHAALVNVALLGCANGTLKVVLGGSVNAGDLLQSNGDGTAIKLLTTTGTFYCIGRALMSGVSGDTIEFAHCFPLKVVNS